MATGYKLATFEEKKLQAPATPPTEECGGSHTKGEQYKL